MRDLPVLYPRLNLFDLIFDMAIGDEQVGPTVKVVIKEEQAECKTQQAGTTNRRLRRLIDEQTIALVVIEAEHLAREVTDRDAWFAGLVVVGGVDAHGAPGNAVFAVGQ